MTVPTLLSLFPKPEDLLALTPKDFGGVIIEVMPALLQNGMFNPAALTASFFQIVGPSYPPGSKRAVELVIAEALSWLVTQGILVPDPGSPHLASMCRHVAHRACAPALMWTRTARPAFLPTIFCPRCSPKKSSRCFVAVTTTLQHFRPSRRLRSTSGRQPTPREPAVLIPRLARP